ncbi:MAG: hypothetical protein IT445_06545 [Phycisphaeraceae bacterium]|nr:hypothetical protein [Phycisphaeraceae bacterium]
MTRKHFIFTLTALALCSWPVPAQQQDPQIEPAPPVEEQPVRTLELGTPAEPIQPQEHDVQALPQRVGIPAASVDIDPAVIGVAPGQPMPTLLREGQFIVNRYGHLRKTNGILLMVFEPRPDQQQPDPPMLMQACASLELIERLIENRGPDTMLKVSGQVHAYRGFNYLLPTLLEPVTVTPAPGSEQTSAPETTGEDTTSTTESDSPSAISHPPSAISEQDTMAQLLALRPSTAPAADAAAETDQPLDRSRPLIEALAELEPTTAAVKIDPALMGIAPEQELPPLKREGEFVVDRRGRLVRPAEGKALLFVFDADSAAAAELPMVVQPCRLRESMEDLVANRGDSVVFIVSGQVHTYRGANYLLPTMMKLAVDKGNLLN